MILATKKTHDYVVLHSFDADGFPDTAVEVIDLLRSAIDGVPEDQRDLVMFEVSSGRFDDSCPEIKISRWVPKPPEELAAAERRERRAEAGRRQYAEMQERQELARLLAKYGAPNGQ